MIAAAAVAGISGCMLAAAQLAPVALHAAEEVGSGVLHVAEHAIISSHEGTEQARKEDDRDFNDKMSNGDSCDQLELQVPGVVELRKSTDGIPSYRELRLNGSVEEAHWAPLVENGMDANGWRPAVNFMQMEFAPPLVGAFPDKGSNYLAYAPSDPISAADENRLVSLTMNFAKAAGTFKYSGRVYDYAVTSTLPCFPPPER
ncbi:MAG TPA: hypothetical protein VEU51_07470 [Candidatus Acidoferrales bacterium]|nr:hypothetical protein [Candidatus Acidoferrales bacterium]